MIYIFLWKIFTEILDIMVTDAVILLKDYFFSKK